MKKVTHILAIAFFAVASPVVITGCKTLPTERRIVHESLKATGELADAAVALSAQLFRDGKITAAQARAVLEFYDKRFQPSFRFAVVAAQGNLSSIASPDLAALASELSSLIASFQKSNK